MAWGRYTDPFDDAEDTPKPRVNRAQRLVDSLDGQSSARRPSAPSENDGVRAVKSAGRVSPVPSKRRPTAVEPQADDFDFPLRTEEQDVPAVSAPAILSVTPEGEGETIALMLALPAEENGDGGGKCRRVKLRLLAEQYADLRAEGIGMTEGQISPETAEALREAGELCEAIRRGLSLLQYGDRSARRLVAGLSAKGISRETAEAAAAYLVRKGYVREEDAAVRRAVQDQRKGWGPRRIREDLWAHGFEGETVDRAMSELDEVDFAEACATVIRKKYGDLPSGSDGAGERRKMIAALMRLGYDSAQIREAMRLLQRET